MADPQDHVAHVLAHGGILRRYGASAPFALEPRLVIDYLSDHGELPVEGGIVGDHGWRVVTIENHPCRPFQRTVWGVVPRGIPDCGGRERSTGMGAAPLQ